MADKVRRPNAKHFAEVQSLYQKSMANIKSLKKKIEALKKETNGKKSLDPTVKIDPNDLSPFELQLKRTELSEAECELEDAKIIHARVSRRYNLLGTRLRAANDARITAKQAKEDLGIRAIKEREDLQRKVSKITNSLNAATKKSMKAVALKDGVKFRLEMDKKVKEKMSSEDWKLLNASSEIKTSIYQNIRQDYGCKKTVRAR